MERTALKVHFANGDSISTEINGNREKAAEYYKIGYEDLSIAIKYCDYQERKKQP